MSGTWRELSPNDSWSVTTVRPLQTAEIGALLHLYQPIIGTDAVSLYVTLCMQGEFHTGSESPLHTHRFLMGLLYLPLDQVLDARHRLEGVGLLNTYRIEEELGRTFRYEMIPPLEPHDFFQTDVLSITLMNRLGKERFRWVRERFCPVKRQHGNQATDVTKKFYEVFTSLAPSELVPPKGSEARNVLTEWKVGSAGETKAGPSFTGYKLDWEWLTVQASSIGSLERLSEAEREKICEWAFLYQLNERALSKALQSPDIYDEQNNLALSRLHEYIKQEYRFRHGQAPEIRELKKRVEDEQGKPARSVQQEADNIEEVHRRWLEKLSPLELLERYHRGGKVPEADVKLVEELYEEYGLPFGVINVLLEFVLLTNDYKLPRPLVEKIAGHWKRVPDLQTVEDAQTLALKELYEPKKRKPARTKKPQRAKKPVKKQPEQEETEEERRRRKLRYEELLAKLRQAQSKGE